MVEKMDDKISSEEIENINQINKDMVNNLNIDNKVNKCTINKPQFYVLIYNLSKSKNIGTLIRSAAAFGCSKIFILGQDKKVLKKFYGSQGTVNKIDFLFFNTKEDLVKYCKDNNISFCGVEIGKESKPINKYSFKGDTLFVLGNEGAGFNKKQYEMCENNLVYIPQHSNMTASLNVAVAASIIFHHFAIWANYDETNLSEDNNEKFSVDNSLVKQVEFINNDKNDIKNYDIADNISNNEYDD